MDVKTTVVGSIDLNASSLVPQFDKDFTRIEDRGDVFIRGNQIYERSYGCKRIALNVAGMYGNAYNNRWLGQTGVDPEEWPVSYHGTGKHNELNIAEMGVKFNKGDRLTFGRGIYSTPELEVAKLYAKRFEHEGQTYFVLIQNRVNPKYLKVIRNEETGIGTYWMSTKGPDDTDNDESDLIRPYAMCVFQT